MTAPGLTPGADGLLRCAWAVSAPEYIDYHDLEWGRAVHGDAALFERLCLEGFQSGLSWLTILRKRDGFRSAFSWFDPRAVAGFGHDDVERLMNDASIVRNRRKIEATIANARALVDLQAAEGDGVLDRLVWSFADVEQGVRRRPRELAEVPASTPASASLSKALKRVGFTFVGPTTCYAAMQACGLVDDHIVGCATAS